MTRPAVIFFGPSDALEKDGTPRSKVFLRTLLYSTSRSGQTVESMHVNIQRGESRQNFSIWVYGDKANLARAAACLSGPMVYPAIIISCCPKTRQTFSSTRAHMSFAFSRSVSETRLHRSYTKSNW